MRAKRSGQRNRRLGFGILLAGCLVCFEGGAAATAWSQAQTAADSPSTQISAAPGPGSLAGWERLPVRRIAIEGIEAARLALLPERLAQAVGAPLTQEHVAESLRQLFATGLFETIAAEGVREGDGVALVFKGTPRTFIGTVSVDGAKGSTINTQLQRASGLSPGTRFTQARLNQALDQMRQAWRATASTSR